MNEEVGLGSFGISQENHVFLSNLVEVSGGEITENKPFTSIVEAYRFAFAIGYTNNQKKVKKGSGKTIAPRQFIVNDYRDILESEARELNKTLGYIVTQYAEAGADILHAKIESGQLISTLFE
tara:strand:+ start:139 stop:507 length:369 start_codon:yes stop_codon:yes gene_type:complete